MGSDLKKESIPELRLPLFSVSHTLVRMQTPERAGASTPPSASVPFRWEEEPGKPKPCTALSTFSIREDSAQKCLELPPRLLVESKQYSLPTTVLEGPFIGRSSRFQSNSFRMGGDCYGSFRSTGNSSPEAVVPYGALVVSKKGQRRDRGILGFWRKRALKGERGVVRGSYVFPSSVDRESDSGREREDIGRSTTVKITRVRRIRSSPNLSHDKSHFWAGIYEGLKQAVPWSKGKGVKKEGLVS
ncbi:hypothetical protein SLE2022_030080 [Rubroshorea leprosula]